VATLRQQAKSLLAEKDEKIRKMGGHVEKAREECESLEGELQDAQMQQGELRSQCAALSGRTEKAEARMNEELLARKKERKRAEKAEARIKELEAQCEAMSGNLQKAKEGMGMMRTIAKIRNLDDETCAVGFDAVGEKTMATMTKATGKRGAGRPRR